jgi:hypothetical protein
MKIIVKGKQLVAPEIITTKLEKIPVTIQKDHTNTEYVQFSFETIASSGPYVEFFIREIFTPHTSSALSHTPLAHSLKSIEIITSSKRIEPIQNYSKAFNNPKLSEIKFIFNDTKEEPIYASKIILGLRSKFFYDFFFETQSNETRKEFEFKETDRITLFRLIQFLYTHEIQLSDLKESDLLSLLSASEHFLVSDLSRLIIDELYCRFNGKNIIDFLKKSHHSDLFALKKSSFAWCESYIQTFLKESNLDSLTSDPDLLLELMCHLGIGRSDRREEPNFGIPLPPPPPPPPPLVPQFSFTQQSFNPNLFASAHHNNNNNNNNNNNYN